jgi:flagellar export protein FliJ
VLRHRETLEGLREQEFGAAQSQLQVQQARMDRLTQEFQGCVAGRPGGARGEHFDAHAIYDRERYLETLQAAMHQQTRRVDTARIAAENRRLALVAARQAREAVSRLRAQELAAHEVQSLKVEQDSLDEQATQRFFRDHKEAPAPPAQPPDTAQPEASGTRDE